MDEVEIKFLEIDRKSTIEKLLALGAERDFQGEVRSVIFYMPKGQLLRLRRKGKRNFLTWKKDISSYPVKHCQEEETEVSSFEDTLTILQELGFAVKREEIKFRESFWFRD